MRTIALINQKGGVGKTTTVANLAAALADRGYRVAAVDLDPQSHLTMHFGLEPGASSPGLYEVLTEHASVAAAAIEVQANLWLVPACIDLAGAEVELVSAVGREQLLADALAADELPFDYVLMDCPPSLGLLTLNALAAADEVIIPLQPHFLALQGFGKLLETVSLIRKRINPRLRVGGVILCMYESSTRLAAEVTDDVSAFLTQVGDPSSPWAEARLYETRIRRNIKLAECPSFGQSIFRYAPGCPGASDYELLADEFLRAHGEIGAAESAGEPSSCDHAELPGQACVQAVTVVPTPSEPPQFVGDHGGEGVAHPSQADPESEPADRPEGLEARPDQVEPTKEEGLEDPNERGSSSA